MSWEIKLLNEPKMMTFFINCKFQLFIKTLLLSVLLIGHTTIFCIGSEPIHSLDFSGNGPLFLLKKQISEDLNMASRLFRDNYVRHPIFEQHGINWEEVFQKLENLLLKDINPVLTHHFQKQLIKALEFTEDSNIQADLFLKKRHYVQRVEPKAAFYTGITLAQQQNRFRVLPGLHQTKNIINHWFINCAKSQEVFFPVLPQRQAELLFMLGMQANHQLKHLNCKFESEAGVKRETLLPLFISKSEINELPLVKFQGSIWSVPNCTATEACSELLKTSIVSGKSIVGFDTESRPSFKKGEHYPIALIQLSTSRLACLFRVSLKRKFFW